MATPRIFRSLNSQEVSGSPGFRPLRLDPGPLTGQGAATLKDDHNKEDHSSFRKVLLNGSRLPLSRLWTRFSPHPNQYFPRNLEILNYVHGDTKPIISENMKVQFQRGSKRVCFVLRTFRKVKLHGNTRYSLYAVLWRGQTWS